MTGKGWTGLPPLEPDGSHWPVTFAADLLYWDERDLRDALRILGVTPDGTIRMAGFARQGRQPAAYNAEKLTLIDTRIRELREELVSRFG